MAAGKNKLKCLVLVVRQLMIERRGGIGCFVFRDMTSTKLEQH